MRISRLGRHTPTAYAAALPGPSPFATSLVGHFRAPPGNDYAAAFDDGKTARTGAQYGNPAIATLMCSKPGDVGVGFQLD